MTLKDHQQRALEQLFSQTSKPTLQQREAIAAQLGVPTKLVQTWFLERRASRAKADKRLEEKQTIAALENAHIVQPQEAVAMPYSRPINHRTQSAASYASLNRAITAARACRPQLDFEDSLPPSPAFAPSSYSQYSMMDSSFDFSAPMSRSESQFSTFTNTPIGEYPEEVAEFPFFTTQSAYMPPAPVSTDFMVYEDPQVAPRPIPTRATRPTLQRTWTAPESAMGRPVPRRTLSSNCGDGLASVSDQSLRMRRRNPKISQLGVNMARSRSSLGYEQSEYPYSVRRANITDDYQEVPITPVRRAPSLGSMDSIGESCSSFALTLGDSVESSQDSPSVDSFVGLQFPPSPITPEHQHSFQMQAKAMQSYHPQFPLNETYTPPATPLMALSANAQNCLLGASYVDTWAADLKRSGLDMNNDLMLTDIFNDQEFSL